MKWLLCSTHGWAMILCVLAAVSPALPWEYLLAYGTWHAPAINIIGGLGFLFVLATSPLAPIRWWRTLVVGLLGVAIIVVALLYYAHHAGPSIEFRDFGGLMEILSASGLLLVTALEVRQLIQRRFAGKAPPQAQA